jgi:uncharacterized membrane protein
LDDDGPVFGIARGLNSQYPSAVVGSHSFVGPDKPSPVLWEKCGRTILPTLAGDKAGGTGEACDVDDSLTIVGWSASENGIRAAVRWIFAIEWQVQVLGGLGGSTSEAFRLNSEGTAVGRADAKAAEKHACVWRPGFPVKDIHTGPGSSTAFGVNRFRDVVGTYDPT